MNYFVAAGLLVSMPKVRKNCKTKVRICAENGAYYAAANVDWNNLKHRREVLKYASILIKANFKITIQRL